MKTKDNIIKLFNKNKELKIQEIETDLKISRQYIHRILAEMLEDQVIIKMGNAPKTIYKLNEKKLEKSERTIISKDLTTFLEQNFIVITEIGELLTGLDAFEYWCKKRKLPVAKTIEEYQKTFQKYEEYKDENGIISGLHKLTSTKELVHIYLNEVWYLDFYAIERFGKTKLGNLIHYAKQGQSIALMKLLLKEIKTPLNNIINEYQIDAVAFVPHTVKRKVQLMEYLEKRLELHLPKLKIDKLDGFVSVPQKSLQRIEERINNADYTFVPHSTKKYKNVLLIDDAVGSGATLNQIAKKIKDKKIAENVFGIAIVGSFKGFDVITEV